MTIKSTYILGLFLLLFHCAAFGAEKQSKPNILFLFTDDHRFSSVSALGIEKIKTPGIDKLAERGMVFSNTHIMGSLSGAVCMPSRAMLMTGKYLFHLNRDGAVLPETDKTLPETLKNNGYNTFGTGKWHNGRESFARSFSHGGKIFFGGMSDHLKVPVNDFDPTGEYSKKEQYIEKKFSSELFADATINFIEGYSDDKPFFAFVSFTAPHDPRMAPKDYLDLYPNDEMELPENYKPKHPFDNGEIIIRDELLAPFPRTEEVIRQEIAGYYAMVSHVDNQINKIITALEASGKAENTIIIFAGDNGLAVGQHGLIGKQNLYEHSVRVPLIFSGLGIRPGTSESLCYLSDIYPTICELAGINIPESVETKSLKKYMESEKVQGDAYESVFFAYKNFQRGVKTKDGWKLISYLVNGKKKTQLFNVLDDPWELKNLASDPKYANKIVELEKDMTRWIQRSGDKVDLKKHDWGVPVIESWVTTRKRKGLPIDASAAKGH